MNCYETTEAIALFVSGDLDAAAAAEIQAHVQECPSCEAALEKTRAVTDLARDALSRVEPGGDFTDAVMSAVGSERPGVKPLIDDVPQSEPTAPAPRVMPRRRAAAIALSSVLAVAAAVLVAVALRTAPAGRVTVGGLADGQVEIVAGRQYTATSGALLEFTGGSKAFVDEGARFALGAGDLELIEGSCIVAGATARGGEVTSVRVGPALVVRFDRADVYVDAGSAAPAVARGGAFLDWLFPVVHAAEGDDTPCVVVAMAGDATIEFTGMTVDLKQGQAVFVTLSPGAETVEPPVELSEFLGATEERIERLDHEAGAHVALIEKYRRTVASYTTDLAAKREQHAALAEDEAPARAELAQRIRLVEELERAHAARLKELVRVPVDGTREGLTRRMEGLLAAQDAYGRMLRLLGPAEPVAAPDSHEQNEGEGEVLP